MKTIKPIIWLFLLGNMYLFADYPTAEVNYDAPIRIISEDVRELGNPVGSIEGIADVNLVGNSTYSIPILTPKGRKSLEPSLSVVYSSGGANSILGFGWSLSGLSSISRVPSNKLIDGVNDKIDFSIDGNLSLDGIRMVKISDSPYTWAPINNNNSRLTCSTDANGNIQTLYLQTKDGKIIEYGGNENSRLKKDGIILSWNISKISDIYGNFIEYYYGRTDGTTNQKGLEVWIEKIEYTGNSQTNDAPFAQIVFDYSIREDKTCAFSAGIMLQSSLLLDKIYVQMKDEESGVFTNIRSYKFNYIKNHSSQLVEAVEYGKNENEAYNSTVFEYNYDVTLAEGNSLDIMVHNVKDFNNTMTNSNLVYTATGSSVILNENQTYYFGDFNNDGIQDRIIVQYNYARIDNINRSRWFLQFGRYVDLGDETIVKYKSVLNKCELFTSVDQETFVTHLLRNKVSIIDINNDGYLDILIPYLKNTQTDDIENWMAGPEEDLNPINMLYDELHLEVHLNSFGTFPEENSMTYVINDDRLKQDGDDADFAFTNEEFHFGDFDADGMIEILLKAETWDYYDGFITSFARNSNNGANDYGFLWYLDLVSSVGTLPTDDHAFSITCNGSNSGNGLSPFVTHDDENFNVIVADFNSDSRSDFMVVTDFINSLGHSETVYTLLNELEVLFEFSDILRSTDIESGDKKHCYQGDFNGDGLFDLLYQKNTNYEGEENISPWCIRFWKGNEFSPEIIVSELENINWGIPYQGRHLIVGDFNFDGRSDVLTYLNTYCRDIVVDEYTIRTRGGDIFEGSTTYTDTCNNIDPYYYDSNFDDPSNPSTKKVIDGNSYEIISQSNVSSSIEYKLHIVNSSYYDIDGNPDINWNTYSYSTGLLPYDQDNPYDLTLSFLQMNAIPEISSVTTEAKNFSFSSLKSMDITGHGLISLHNCKIKNYLLSFNISNSSSFLSKVYDGFGNSTEFTYQTLSQTNDPDLETPAYSVNEFRSGSYHNISGGIKIVSEMLQKNSSGSWYNKMVYNYQDGIINRDKGFIGFLELKRNQKDYNLGDKSVITKNAIRHNIAELYPEITEKYSGDSFISETYKDCRSTDLGNGRYFLYDYQVITTNQLDGSRNHKITEFDNDQNLTREKEFLEFEGQTIYQTEKLLTTQLKKLFGVKLSLK